MMINSGFDCCRYCIISQVEAERKKRAAVLQSEGELKSSSFPED